MVDFEILLLEDVIRDAIISSIDLLSHDPSL